MAVHLLLLEQQQRYGHAVRGGSAETSSAGRDPSEGGYLLPAVT
jgi:hypothetical protein